MPAPTASSSRLRCAVSGSPAPWKVTPGRARPIAVAALAIRTAELVMLSTMIGDTWRDVLQHSADDPLRLLQVTVLGHRQASSTIRARAAMYGRPIRAFNGSGSTG